MSDHPTEQEVLGYADELKNWGRWGSDDELGTMNFLTDEKTARAAALVRTGKRVTCGRPIEFGPTTEAAIPPIRFMISSGEGAAATGRSDALDFFGLAYHGMTITHIDGICHAFWNGLMYNGRPASLVTTREGAKAGAIELLRDGIIGRGVLLDMPRLLGTEWMEPGQGVLPAHLEAAEKAEGVHVEEGDILLIRTGNYKRRLTLGPLGDGGPGPHVALLPWIRERGVALLGSDTPNDVLPHPYPNIEWPMHCIGIVAMGLWLMDNANLEEISTTCAELSRWEFLLSVAPLRLQGGTGSPVNPIAVF